ncbi:hypothetical protein D9M68_792010 [compost metagenome]
MREKRILLEHHPDVSVVGGKESHVTAADGDPTGTWGFEPGYHRQGGRFAGAGRSKQRDKFPGSDAERQVADRQCVAVPFLKSREG